jgi:hypothetical protein
MRNPSPHLRVEIQGINLEANDRIAARLVSLPISLVGHRAEHSLLPIVIAALTSITSDERT